MDFMSHYDGSYRGQGRFRGEIRRKVQLTGTITPIPEAVESPSRLLKNRVEATIAGLV